MTEQQAVAFVKRHGVVTESARGTVPSLAEEIAGEPIKGSWWGHPRGKIIFQATQVIVDSPDILVCKMIDGKVTYIHRRLWPALVKLASRFSAAQLARTWQEHTESGAHVTKRIPFPKWVPADIIAAAKSLSTEEAEQLLSPLLATAKVKARGSRQKPSR